MNKHVLLNIAPPMRPGRLCKLQIKKKIAFNICILRGGRAYLALLNVDKSNKSKRGIHLIEIGDDILI